MTIAARIAALIITRRLLIMGMRANDGNLLLPICRHHFRTAGHLRGNGHGDRCRGMNGQQQRGKTKDKNSQMTHGVLIVCLALAEGLR